VDVGTTTSGRRSARGGPSGCGADALQNRQSVRVSSGAPPSGELTLHLERLLPAPPEVVFRMHAEPDLLAKWWGPKGFSTPTIDLDVRVGGAYRIAMQPPGGEALTLSGEFREVEPPTRLVYTFRWDPPDPDDRETIAAVSFRDLGAATQLVVHQGSFATDARLAVHQRGWSETLDRLHQLMSD
jgi:uncharacterized protein YndB with AHSA1/START domain